MMLIDNNGNGHTHAHEGIIPEDLNQDHEGHVHIINGKEHIHTSHNFEENSLEQVTISTQAPISIQEPMLKYASTESDNSSHPEYPSGVIPKITQNPLNKSNLSSSYSPTDDNLKASQNISTSLTKSDSATNTVGNNTTNTVLRKVSKVEIKYEGVGHSRTGNVLTFGLMIHAAVDGVAIGASSTSPEVALVVFLAIFMHKAPAAFGLTSILKKGENTSDKKIKRNLCLFSLAAPVGAILTFLILSVLGKSVDEHGHDNSLVPSLALLFSAGTFLYISTMHVLPEVSSGKALSNLDLGLIIIGSFIPLCIVYLIQY